MIRRALLLSLGTGLLLAPGAHAKVFGGIVPDLAPGSRHHPRAAAAATPQVRADNLPNQGGPVLHWNRTHIIFWIPAGSGLSFEPGYQALASQFLADVAGDSRRPTNVYSLSGQYSDTAGPAAYDSTWGGAIVDANPLPPSGCSEPLAPPLGTGPGWSLCVNDSQIENEIDAVVNSRHLPSTPNDIYFLLTPNGLGDCQQGGPDNCALGGSGTGYCGYHSQTSSNILYAVIPYNAVSGHCQSDHPRPNGNPVDPTLSTLSHEHNETVTDPNPLNPAWISFSGGNVSENGDLCVTGFGPTLGRTAAGTYNQVIGGHPYYLQNEWSNDDSSCQPRDENDSLSLHAGRRTRIRERITFTGRGSDPDGSIVSYLWSFGDGRSGHGRRPVHVFRRSGSYLVTVRATDSAGTWTFTTRRIRVSGPAGSADRHRRRRQRR